MVLRPTLLSLAIVTSLAIGLSACSDEKTEEEAALEADAGTDADQDMPSVESVDFDDSEPSEPQRIHVESSSKRGVISDDPPLAMDDFFSQDDAERLITDTDLETITIAGQDVSPTQNSIRYAPAGAEHDIFGVGLQVWDMSDEEMDAPQRVAALRQQFLNVDDDIDGASDDAFLSERSGIRSLVFLPDEGPYVFILSCDVDHCSDVDELVQMGNAIAAEH